MATYKYQQNLFEGSSAGYVKYNITPDFGTPISTGTTVTITGQAYLKSRASKSIEVSTSSGSAYRSASVNVNIKKATVTNFTITFPMWDLSSWNENRVFTAPIEFAMWSGADATGNGDGTMSVSSQSISFLRYRISPARKSASFERYSLSGGSYFKNDEGTYVFGSFAISLAEGRTYSDITVANVVVTNDTGFSRTISLSSSVLQSALESSGYREASPSLFSGISFNTAYNYMLTFTIGDAYDKAVFQVLVSRAFANIHLAGARTGGVAFGRFSSATLNNPKFECEYPAYLNGGIAGTVNINDINMHWTDFPLASGITSPHKNRYGGGRLKYGYIGKHVFIKGSILAKNGASIGTIPSSLAPQTGNMYKLAACGGARIARLIMKTGGEFMVEWLRNISNGDEYNTAVWIDCDFDYWID